MREDEDIKMDSGKSIDLTDVGEFLPSNEDEELLQVFFAEHQMEIPDDGFSQKVMERLPAPSRRRAEHWWLAACILMGVVFIFSTQFVGSLQDSLFASKVATVMFLSKLACNMGEFLAEPRQLLMLLGGIFTVFCVWGYNKVLDARI